MKVFGFIAIVVAVLSGLFLLLGISGSSSAPQEASVAAIACAAAIIPYIIYRVLQTSEAARKQQRIIELLERQANSSK